MKTIGIKLADGSFYPVLEDNTPSEKKLELTTAHNNQTKVMVDLYRSATCSMEDAEYVDSLQIDNLNAHPNGEADIKFTVSLDEDNQLSAKIVDSETGNESNTSITLVSRTLEERLVTDEYDINDSEEKSGAGAAVAGAVAAGGLLAAAAALRNKGFDEEETTESEPETEPEAVVEEPEVETIEESVPVEDETFVDEPVVEESVEESTEEEIITEDEPVFDETPVEETTDDIVIDEPITEEANDDFVIDEPVATDEPTIDETTVEETIEDTETTEDIAGELSEMDFDLPEDTELNTSDDTVISDDTELPDMDFDLPDDTDSTVDEPVETTADFETSDDTISADDTISDDSTLPDMDFDFPDDTESTETTETETDSELPDDFFNTDDFDNTEDTMNDSTFDTDSPVAGGLNFDGLYDEETERGTSTQTDEDDVKKKTKVPVIICIICAIICIIATLLILFIIPSKYNLITKKHAKEAVAVEAPAPEPSPAPVVEPEPEPEPAVPEAKEDEIIIIEKAEEVVPSQPPVAEEKPKDITYKIKWGDTLWDIADTYYKNPWRYKYIARYNGIKNPDYIISGTIITIPAQ